MKNIDQSTVELIFPDDLGHGVTREKFAALFRVEDLVKIEKALKLPSPSEGFRQSLIEFLWKFYINSLPEAEAIVSRSALKKELETSAELAGKLEKSAERLLKSRDPVIVEHLSRFAAAWQPWQSSQPMHPSGIAWIHLISELALMTRRLASMLTDDSGGPRPARPFDDLVIGLEDYQRQLASHGRLGSESHFFQFMAAVVDALREVESKLPAAKFRLPANDEALGKRLTRLNEKRRQAQSRT
jgi:hypothetical protein